MTLPGAFYRRDGDAFVATALTRGPWGQMQHGGPPSALLGGAIARFGDTQGRHVTRVTVELLRPIPIGPLRVSVEPLRLGRRVEWLTASLFAGDVEVATARGLRQVDAGLELPEPHCPAPPKLRSPEASKPFAFDFFGDTIGYHLGVDVRVCEGQWGAAGPVAGWMRMRAPLVLDEPTLPIERVLTLADAQNGLCTALKASQFAFINPDLAVYLRRPHRGEWLGLRTRSNPENTGAGLVQSELHDIDGDIGRSLESLSIAPART